MIQAPHAPRTRSSTAVGAAPSATTPQIVRQFLSTNWERARKTLRGQFITLAVLILALSVIQAVTIAQSFQHYAEALDTIHNSSSPSVDAAQTLGQYVNDIDAKAADYLATADLTSQAPCNLPGPNQVNLPLTVHDCDGRIIDDEFILANQQLYKAAHNVTYPGEQTAIERITLGLQEYTANIEVMFSEFDLAQKAGHASDPTDAHMKNAYYAYKAANSILQTKIPNSLHLGLINGQIIDEQGNLPSCSINQNQPVGPEVWVGGSIQNDIDCLSDINYTHLQAVYQEVQGSLAGSFLYIVIICLLQLALLGFTAFRMMYFSRRFINLGLTPALLVCIIFSITVLGIAGFLQGSTEPGVAASHGPFQQMVDDDYKSVYAAARLHRDGTNANADESRWLVALKFGDTSAVSHWQVNWNDTTTAVNVEMETAQRNITWDGESEAITAMTDSWGQYTQLDVEIRGTATNTKDADVKARLNKAEELSTGQSNQQFDRFFSAVSNLSNVNSFQYEATYQSAHRSLMAFVPLCLILFPLMGLAAVFGIGLRLKDF